MRTNDNNLYLGIDVQVKRGCSYYLVNSELEYIDSGWLDGPDQGDICQQLRALIAKHLTHPEMEIAVGIDAPRMGLPAPRKYYWRDGGWVNRTSQDRGYGRHCEVVIKALGIANPQWTRLKDQSPPWMALGYSLYQTLHNINHLYEVFPSASYKLLDGNLLPVIGLSFAHFVHGPKDMLDACVCAYTVHAFINGRGFEVGGGDGMGTIILPGQLPVSDSYPVLHWPKD